MEKNTIICASCGQTISMEPDMQKGFCLHCGVQFTVKQAAELPVDISHVRQLWEKREWRALLAYADGAADDPELAVYKNTAQIFVLMLDYDDAAAQLAKETKPRNAVEYFFGGNRKYTEDPLHKTFYAAMEQAAGRLAALLAQSDAADILKEQACILVVEELLRPKGGENTPAFWSYVVCEKDAAPLIPLLSREALTDIYAVYSFRNPKNQCLPIQLDIHKAFTTAIKEKGGSLPSRAHIRKTGKERVQAEKDAKKPQ